MKYNTEIDRREETRKNPTGSPADAAGFSRLLQTRRRFYFLLTLSSTLRHLDSVAGCLDSPPWQIDRQTDKQTNADFSTQITTAKLDRSHYRLSPQRDQNISLFSAQHLLTKPTQCTKLFNHSRNENISYCSSRPKRRWRTPTQARRRAHQLARPWPKQPDGKIVQFLSHSIDDVI